LRVAHTLHCSIYLKCSWIISLMTC
jgi:hypothetical protein